MKILFKKIFPLLFKLKDNYNNKQLTFEEYMYLAVYYVIGKSYPIIIIFTIVFLELIKYLYTK